MAAGEFSSTERQAVDSTIRRAEQRSRCEFSVFVGHAEGDPRSFTTQLHNSLVAPSRSIMIMVDPGARLLEVVTGGFVRTRLTDDEVESAIAQMTADFAEGDLVGGITRGIDRLAEDARD